MAKVKPTVIQRAKRLLRDDGGVLTRELMRSPGGFGLGAGAHAAEAGRDHDHGLRLLLHGLRARRAHARRGGHQPNAFGALSREPGDGVPEGLGVAGAAARSGPRPLAHAAHVAGLAPHPRGLGRGADHVHRALQGHSGQARSGVGRVSWAPGRSPWRSWPSWARSPSSAWACGTATATRASAWPRPSWRTRSASASMRRPTPMGTSRTAMCCCSWARTRALRTPSCGSACAATRTTPRWWWWTRGAPRPPNRRRYTCPSHRRATSSSSTRWRTCSSAKAGSTTSS
jgi:hypothetical protein